MDKLKMHSPDLSQENIAKIRELFPGCVTEARDDKTGTLRLAVDFDQLRQELSDHIVEGPHERYRLDWPGKREAVALANRPTSKTLRPFREESEDFDNTKNIFIEGDNLDALKLLQQGFLGMVRVIYIDPPYNTGNDFIYDDEFSENIGDFLKRSNQVGPDGSRLTVNREGDGRFHSKWLSMMLPRLRLARTLLAENGAIFVSIGVEELSNLKKLMDEVFGAENFIEVFSWVKTSTPPALSTKSRKTNEYILCYEKSRSSFKYKGRLLDGGDQPLLNTGNSIRELRFPCEKVTFGFMENGHLPAGTPDRVTLLDDLEIISGMATKDFVLRGEFKWTQEFLDREVSEGTTFIIKSDKLSIRFIRCTEGYKRPTNFIKQNDIGPLISKKGEGVGTNESASSELSELMGGLYFSYPKPVSLIRYLLGFLLEENDIVLDFFAGSGTTGHATMDWMSTNTRARFILVQIAEDLQESERKVTDSGVKKILQDSIEFLKKAGRPYLLSELTKERLRMAAQRYKASALSATHTIDTGFRVFKIDSTNMKDIYYFPDELAQDDLFESVDNVKPDRTPEDLLFQVLVDWGVDLTLPIRRETLQGKTVFFVDDNALVACFDQGVSEELVKELAKVEPLRVVFRDNGFASDALKINVEQIFRQLSPTTELKTL